jgi:RND family efflux transporter MFP subunit
MPVRPRRSATAALLVSALLLAGCLERTAPTVSDAPRPVQVVRVALRPVDTTRSYPATIRPRHEADMSFRVGGRIVERPVDAGARVAAGQVLARLDPTDFMLAVASAQADLTSAQVQADQTAAEAARSAALVRLGHVSASDDDSKQMAARTARQRVASTQAALLLARNRLEYATLRAPADGVVTATLADPGTVVAEATPVLRLADGPMEAEAQMPENAVADLRAARASVSLWAKPDAPLAAILRELSPQADARLRTYPARFTLADPPDWLALGMTATVRLTLPAPPDAAPVAVLPVSALADRGSGPMVWLVDPATSRLSPRPVQVRVLREHEAIVAGLPDGALVVSLGVQKLDPAAKVAIADIRKTPTSLAQE